LKATGPGSFAKHEALGTFYPAVIDLADQIAEAYQGAMLELIEIPLLDNDFPGEIKAALQAQRKWIAANRFKAVPKDETQMQNIIDEVVALYDTTIYKLHFLG
jgi:DNA-binding ferritin-like protein